MAKDFEEIAHCGGTVTVEITETERGLAYSMQYSNSHPIPMALFTIYALPQGIPVERVNTMGMGVPFPAPKVPGSYLVFIGSDQEGWFGRTCPHCRRYWRSSPSATGDGGFCPYCGMPPREQICLTDAQNRYVKSVCDLIGSALASGPGVYPIDLDRVADEVAEETATPSFYYSEERQQTKMVCDACGYAQDVAGKTSYCCVCGTRNDRSVLKLALEDARQRARSGHPEGALRDAVSAFDGFADGLVRGLVSRVPMNQRRRTYWSGKRPRHDLIELVERLDRDFGFRCATSVREAELSHAYKMVHRRHVHEHRNGIVDQDYLDATGDDVRLDQALRETQEDVFSFIGSLSKISNTMASDFEEIFPPDKAAIARGQDRNRRRSRS